MRGRLWWGLGGLYVATRLVNLVKLPIFTDEANYLNWGWIALRGDLFYPLFDAKQPGLMWVFGVFEQIFSDPLWGGRLVSVIIGLLNVVGIWKVAQEVFSRRTAMIAGLLYVIVPWFGFYDRQALMESTLIGISVWTLWLMLKIASEPRVKMAVGVGILWGVGMWVKSSVVIGVAVGVGAFVYLAMVRREKTFEYLTCLLVALMVGLGVAGPLLMQEDFWATWSRNRDYTMTVGQIARFPWQTWKATVEVNSALGFWLLTPVVFLAAAAGMVKVAVRGERGVKNRIFLGWVCLPLLTYLLTAKFAGPLFGRYAVQYVVLWVILAAEVLASRWRWVAVGGVIPAAMTGMLVFDPPGYFRTLSRVTKYSYIQGYVTGQDTGYQVEAIMKYLKSVSEGPIWVGVELVNYNPTAGVVVYARKNRNMEPVYINWQLPRGYEQYECVATQKPMYLVAVSDDLGEMGKFFEYETTITNNYSPERNSIYRLKTDCPEGGMGRGAVAQVKGIPVWMWGDID